MTTRWGWKFFIETKFTAMQMVIMKEEKSRSYLKMKESCTLNKNLH